MAKTILGREAVTPGERLRALFERFGADGERALEEGADLYAEGMEFQDPLQRLVGREPYLAMCRRLLARARTLRFEVRELVETDRDIFMTWRMDLTPRVGPRVVSEGVSHCRLRDGRIVWHRDYWDLVGDVLGQVPLVGRAWRGLVRRLG